MRIISGAYKGRRISPPRNLPVRPTTDMGKEALFNILGNRLDFDGLRVLDLFAGTGNISYEFCSRGAEAVACVDEDFGCIRFIRQTAAQFGFPITAYKSGVFPFLEKIGGNYDIVFADPPYQMEQAQFEKLIGQVFDKKILADDGMLVVEHSKYTKLGTVPHFSFEKVYGGSVFTFFEWDPIVS